MTDEVLAGSATAASLQATLAGLVVRDGVSLARLGEVERNAVLALACSALPAVRALPEARVNAELERVLAGSCRFLGIDHVELRRWLVDGCWLTRDRYGRAYRRAAIDDLPPRMRDPMRALAEFDAAAWVDALRAASTVRRRQRRAAWERRTAWERRDHGN